MFNQSSRDLAILEAFSSLFSSKSCLPANAFLMVRIDRDRKHEAYLYIMQFQTFKLNMAFSIQRDCYIWALSDRRKHIDYQTLLNCKHSLLMVCLGAHYFFQYAHLIPIFHVVDLLYHMASLRSLRCFFFHKNWFYFKFKK